MLYDIFISYSRQDSQQVDSLINYLHRVLPGIRIWYDREGIETAEEFHDKIIAAIDDSNVVIFVCSDNSLSSKYCKKEVMYAKAVGKTVIPYLLPGMTLKGWLLFEFGNINCVRSTHIDEINRMVQDLRRWSEQKNGDSHSNIQNPGTTNEKSANGENSTIESQLVFDSASGEFKQRNNPGNDSQINTGVGVINGHEYVDLGLPSGLKWATCNIGANRPEAYGDYYAWGEIRTKSAFTKDNSECYGKDIQWLKGHGYIGNSGVLTISHDVARQRWGGSWRMPTQNDIKELIDNTRHERVTINGVNGYKIRSKRNGNSIFLPAAGFRDTSLQEAGEFGVYWSSTPHLDYAQEAYYLDFDSDFFELLSDDRHLGRSVRPVSF